MYGWCFDQPCCTRCFFEDEFVVENSGYVTHEFSGSSEAPDFVLSSGRLNLSNGSPVASGSYRRRNIPSDGATISVHAKVYSIAGADKTGVFIGDAVAFVANWSSGQLERYDVDEFGEATGSATAFSTVATGDRLLLTINAGSSAGLYDLQFSKNGANVRTETDTALDLTDIEEPWTAGMLGIEGGEWDDFGTRCGISACNRPTAGTIYAVQYTITASGFSNSGHSFCPNGLCSGGANCADWNGDFVVTHAGSIGGINCEWQSETFDCNGSQRHRYFMLWDTTPGVDKFRIRVSGNLFDTGAAQYEISGTFDPFGTNTFNFVSGSVCCNFPSTLTVNPV